MMRWHPRHVDRHLFIASAVIIALTLSGCSTQSTSTPGAAPSSQPPTPVLEPSDRATPRPVASRTLQRLGWVAVQAPSRSSVVELEPSREFGEGRHPFGTVLAFTLRPGETTVTSGYRAPRAEVYGRVASASAPPSAWPDPPGSVRWFKFSVLVPRRFTFSPRAEDWMVITQWKGLRGGGPPIALEIKGRRLRLAGTRGNAGAFIRDGDMGRVRPGRWTELSFGLKFSPRARSGWVMAYRDGRLRVPRTRVATMDLVSGKVDPVYVKQGIYRSDTWRTATTVFFSPLQVVGD